MNDASPLPLLHVGDDEPAETHDVHQCGIDAEAPLLFGELEKRSRGWATCIRDEDVDLTELRERRIEPALQIVAVRDVAGDSQVAEIRSGARADREAAALAREGCRRRASEALRCRRDHRDAIANSEIH